MEEDPIILEGGQCFQSESRYCEHYNITTIKANFGMNTLNNFERLSNPKQLENPNATI